MKISKQAGKGHLIVGAILVLLSFISLILAFNNQSMIFVVLIFFFGVWGGIECGRYLEHIMITKQSENAK